MNGADYGPNQDEVQSLIDLCVSLTADQMFDMAEAHRARGIARGSWEALSAARKAGREQQAGNAGYALEQEVKMYALLHVDEDTASAVAWAANDAGVAAATRDLVGMPGYSKFDHMKLASAWEAGFQ